MDKWMQINRKQNRGKNTMTQRWKETKTHRQYTDPERENQNDLQHLEEACQGIKLTFTRHTQILSLLLLGSSLVLLRPLHFLAHFPVTIILIISPPSLLPLIFRYILLPSTHLTIPKSFVTTFSWASYIPHPTNVYIYTSSHPLILPSPLIQHTHTYRHIYLASYLSFHCSFPIPHIPCPPNYYLFHMHLTRLQSCTAVSPLNAGISNVCILESVTRSAKLLSFTETLKSVLPRMICRDGSTILLTSTCEMRTYPVTCGVGGTDYLACVCVSL